MARSAAPDLLRLSPEGLAFHQAATFAAAPAALVGALQESPLFTVSDIGSAVVAEWTRVEPESESSPCAFGRVTVHNRGVLLETFGETRLEHMKHLLRTMSTHAFGEDEVRVIPLRSLFARPEMLFSPLADETPRAPDRHSAARIYLRMAWPFFPREDLRGRTPEAVGHTDHGKQQIESLLEALPAELLAALPRFPHLSPDELREDYLASLLHRETPEPIDEAIRVKQAAPDLPHPGGG